MARKVHTAVSLAFSALLLAGCGNSALTYGTEENAWKAARDKGRAAAKQADYKQAQEQYEIAVTHARHVEQTNPGHLTETLMDLADVYLQQGKRQQAIENYQAALKASDQMLNGNTAAASELYKRVGTLCKLRSLMSLGKLYAEDKDYAKATEMFETGLTAHSRLLPAVCDLKREYAEVLDAKDNPKRDPERAKTLRREAHQSSDGYFDDL